ncbi:hypothetical protein ABEB36_013337 [Hypothenemus hampei]|uniref:Fibronectin type-III domain-containing protein n=1 Tax=Hypothenemus hampei TaxID=57062 RepID=A0ABD1E9P9_HYPHA
MQPPKCLHRNLHDISISWEEIKEFGSYEDSSKVYQLQINNEVKQWTTIYCGKNTLFKVDSLAPCRSYSFRIRIKSQESDWVYFKAATVDPGPYTSVIHMTRAIKLGNTSNIRKIAQISSVFLLKCS